MTSPSSSTDTTNTTDRRAVLARIDRAIALGADKLAERVEQLAGEMDVNDLAEALDTLARLRERMNGSEFLEQLVPRITEVLERLMSTMPSAPPPPPAGDVAPPADAPLPADDALAPPGPADAPPSTSPTGKQRRRRGEGPSATR